MGFTQSIKSNWKSWAPVVLLMLLAAFIRLRITWDDDYYVLEGDGPYYPLQARSLFENFRMAMPDMPLVFVIESLFAKLIQIFTSCTPDECVLMGIRFTDAFLPPLAAIPAFLITKELKLGVTKNNFRSYLIVGFAILNISTVLIFSYCIHKNALGVVWVFCYFLFIIRFIKYSQKKHLYIAILFLVLCALTHFGSFSVLLLFSTVLGFFWLFRKRTALSSFNYKKILLLLVCVTLIISLVAIFDFARFNRLMSIPLKIFEAPLILLFLHGQNTLNNVSPINWIVMTLLFLVVLITFIVNRRNMNPFHKTLSKLLLLFTFLIINPFLGIDWADRLYMMSFVPITVLCFISFDYAQRKWTKILLTTLILGVICFSVLIGFIPSHYTLLNKEEFSEFKVINKKTNFSKNSVIVGYKDLRLLASWFFRTKSADDYALTKEDVKRFDSVYVIIQIKRFKSSQHQSTNVVPTNSIRIYKGEYFEIYKLLNAYQWVAENKGGPPRLRGIIDSLGSNKITVLNTWNGRYRTAELSNKTVIHLNSGDTILKEGMYIEVWGKGRPFSLIVDAEEISAKKYFLPK